MRTDTGGMPLTLAALSTAHAFVDAACAALVLSLVHIYPLANGTFIKLIVSYNLLAFALQPLFGSMVDRFPALRESVTAGIAFVIAGCAVVMHSAFAAVVLAGIGNALFHVGGGVAVLRMRQGRAWPSGIFVAPGAVGLAAGALLGRHGILPVIPVVAILAVLLAVLFVCSFPSTRHGERIDRRYPVSSFTAVLVLLSLSVALRSLLGFSAGGLWRGDSSVLFAFAVAAMAGKAAGGIVADRFGWTLTGTAALVVMTFVFGGVRQWAWCAVFGMFLLQMTMPVTLAAMYRLFPRQPGLAFGICCLALIAGAIPVFSPLSTMMKTVLFIVPCALVSAATFFAGLQLLSAHRPVLRNTVKGRNVSLDCVAD